MEWHLLGQSN